MRDYIQCEKKIVKSKQQDSQKSNLKYDNKLLLEYLKI